MTKFKHVLVGTLTNAAGHTFTITQIKRGGTCKITDANGNISYAGSVPKAWCNARFQAGINQRDHHSHHVVWARNVA